MRFYNRDRELELLETLYSRLPSFVVLTGRRRVGKTELIKKFSSGRKSLYFFVDSNKSIGVLLSEFEEYVKEALGLPDYVKFKSSRQFLEFLFDHKEDVVVAFDEFQRFLKVDPSFITELQRLWDLKGNSSRVFLVTSGSSIGMMKKIFTENKAPLFKRADNILTVRDFPLKEVFKVMDDLGIKDVREKLDLYCLFGGTIYYYRLMEKYGVKSFREAVDNLILNDLAPLKNEVREIMVEEFGREHATYYEILSAMALGKTSKKEMGDATHISPNSLSPYLYDLIELLQVAEHVIPVTEAYGKTKKGRYVLKDNFFRFYFRFIYRHMSQYSVGNYGPIKERIASEWNEFRGRVFEDVAMEFARRKMSEEFPSVGRFWDRRGNEVDVVGLNNKSRVVFMAEVKARKLSYDAAVAVINNLKEKTFLLPVKNKKIRYGLIAVDVGNKEKLEKEGYLVHTLKDLIEG